MDQKEHRMGIQNAINIYVASKACCVLKAISWVQLSSGQTNDEHMIGFNRFIYIYQF